MVLLGVMLAGGQMSKRDEILSQNLIIKTWLAIVKLAKDLICHITASEATSLDVRIWQIAHRNI
jgi:hypothetical protein